MKKVLIANRGEIAVRVIRALKEKDISSVAIFSEVDRQALHVRLAYEAYLVGSAESERSYLNMQAIISIAVTSIPTGLSARAPGQADPMTNGGTSQ